MEKKMKITFIFNFKNRWESMAGMAREGFLGGGKGEPGGLRLGMEQQEGVVCNGSGTCMCTCVCCVHGKVDLDSGTWVPRVLPWSCHPFL